MAAWKKATSTGIGFLTPCLPRQRLPLLSVYGYSTCGMAYESIARLGDGIEGPAMPDDHSHALILYMFAAVAGLSFLAAVYFVAWAYR
jgi:hypothetical protein